MSRASVTHRALLERDLVAPDLITVAPATDALNQLLNIVSLVHLSGVRARAAGLRMVEAHVLGHMYCQVGSITCLETSEKL